jgi:hypothetical protein
VNPPGAAHETIRVNAVIDFNGKSPVPAIRRSHKPVPMEARKNLVLVCGRNRIDETTMSISNDLPVATNEPL